jgi:tripartite-type tricarboxylate transporter receptor subunit TctC
MEDDVKRICAALLALAGACLLVSAPAAAQTWPNRPVRIVNTFAPGGAADFLARTVAENLTTAFKQQFFVETHAGAAGAIGVNLVAATPPDGYNFVITNITMLVLSPISNPKLGYDPYKDLTNIAYLGGSPIVLSVNAKGDIKTFADFIAAAKKSPKPMTFSSSGVGSAGHLFGELLAQKLDLKFEHVPYKGAALGLMDLVGGHIMFSAQTVTSTAPQMRGGTLRGLAVTSKERIKDFPDLATFTELGYPEFTSSIWFSLSAPAGLPKDIADKVNREVAKTMTSPAVNEKMLQQGMITEAMTQAELKTLIGSEHTRWKPVLEKAGLIQKK